MEQEYYFFNFVFISNDDKQTAVRYTNIFLGFDDERITESRIAEAKEQANLAKNVVLLGVNYLGKMTNDEFYDKTD